MKLTWLGHACFLLEQNGYRLIVDPYTGVEGYPELRVKAHQVVCSHQHHDHNAVEQITPLPAQENPFTIRVVKTFHDDQGGALRGENTIHVISAGGHHSGAPGRLGASTNGGAARRHRHGGWSPGALVGGVYTVDAAGARQVCKEISPRWVVPMHYRHCALRLA